MLQTATTNTFTDKAFKYFYTNSFKIAIVSQELLLMVHFYILNTVIIVK